MASYLSYFFFLMRLRPPRSTRTYSRLPYTTLFRSTDSILFDLTSAVQPVRRAWVQAASVIIADFGLSTSLGTVVILTSRLGPAVPQKELALEGGVNPAALVRTLDRGEAAGLLERTRSDKRRVGKEGVSTCSSRWSPSHSKKKHNKKIN